MTRYAETTTVTSDASRGEIERTLTRYGADGFMYGWDQSRAVLGFVALLRLVVALLWEIELAAGPGNLLLRVPAWRRASLWSRITWWLP